MTRVQEFIAGTIIACIISVYFLMGTALAEPDQEKTFTAFSLKTARNMLARGEGDLRAVRALGHITHPFGLVVDQETDDLILVGQRDPTRPALHLDDLVVALYSVFRHERKEAPGVTINARGDMRTATMQDVIFFGGIDQSRFGQVCFEADYLMKQIGLGLEPIRSGCFQSFFDLSVEEIIHNTAQLSEVGSRFWFYPITARVVSAGDGVFLDRVQIEVLTEILYVYDQGQPVSDLKKVTHRPSKAFSDGFSACFQEMAGEYPVLKDLENLTQLTAIARGLSKMEVVPELQYWLDEYERKQVPIRPEVEVLTNVDAKVGLKVQGGVYLQSLALRLKGGDASALTDVVLATRTSPPTLTWSFTLTRDWEVIVNDLSGEVDALSASEYYARAEYLFVSGEYDLAIANWRQITRIYPEMGELYFKIGQAFEQKGMLDIAADYYTKGLQLDPFLSRNHR